MMTNPAEDRARTYGLTQILRLSEGITRGELARLLRDAAVEAEGIVGQSLGHSGDRADRVRVKEAAEALRSLSRSMWESIGSMTRQGIHSAADLVVDQQIDLLFLNGMSSKAIAEYAVNLRFSAFQSAEDIISRRTNGFQLAERIYRGATVGVEAAAHQVELGLAQQMSSKQIARRVRGFFSPDVPGGISYAANRLARTEINNAHHDTTIRLTKGQPWVSGYKWHLSGSHPKADICDEYASKDESDMGPGVYSKSAIPSKGHPHCLCYIEIVQEDRDDFIDKLVDGKYDNYLAKNGVY